MSLKLLFTFESTAALVPRLLLKHGGIAHDASSMEEAAKGVQARTRAARLTMPDGEVINGDLAIARHLCRSFPSLESFYPVPAEPNAIERDAAEHDEKALGKVFDYCRTALANRVDHATKGENEELLAIALNVVKDTYLNKDGHVVSDAVSVGDLALLCCLRPWMCVEGRVPFAIRELERKAEAALHGWEEIMEPFDRLAIRAAEDGQDVSAIPPGHSSAWMTGIGPSRPVQPRDVVRLAENVSVDIKKETRLLWLVRSALETPLAPQWRVVGHRPGSGGASAGGDSRPSTRGSLTRSMTHHGGGSDSRGGSRGGLGTPSKSFHPSTRRTDESEDESEKGVRFVNRLSGETTHIHPGATFLLSQISGARKFAESVGVELGISHIRKRPGDAGGAWMRFREMPDEEETKRKAREDAAAGAGSGGGGTGAGAGGTSVPASKRSSVASSRRSSGGHGGGGSGSSTGGGGVSGSEVSKALHEESKKTAEDDAPAGAKRGRRRSAAFLAFAAGVEDDGTGHLTGHGHAGHQVGAGEEEPEGGLKMSMGSLGHEMGMPELSRPTTHTRPDTNMSTRQRLDAADRASRPPESDPDDGYFYHNFFTGREEKHLPGGAVILPANPAAAGSAAAAPRVEQGDTEPESSLLDTDASAHGGTLGRTRASYAASVASSRAKHVSDLKTLFFKSWWYEGGGLPEASINDRKVSGSTMKKHVLDVFYSIEDGSFTVALEGDDKMYSLSHINGKDGPLECWDLHVGARVNVLGRMTSLMQANNSTQRWIDHHAVRLRKLIARMEREVVKYDRAGAAELMRKRKQPEKPGGRNNLRGMLELVDALRRALAKYRPKLAQSIVQSIHDPHAR